MEKKSSELLRLLSWKKDWNGSYYKDINGKLFTYYPKEHEFYIAGKKVTEKTFFNRIR